ncbi:MAG TPA: ATP-binding protein [Steroidobacteraceae bacterium]|nr:ATP-binding protein [Steroidobacteraceae bacterium]
MERDLAEQLAQAFGLTSADDVESLVARLRAGDNVDITTLRRGVLALVDDLRETRAKHETSDQRLKIALGASELGLWEWDVVTNDIAVDHTYCRFFGRKTQGEVWKMDELAKFVHEEDRPAFRVALREVLQGDRPVLKIEHRVLHTDGRWVWLETYGAVTERDAAGRALRMTGTHTNITERKQTQRALSNTLRVMHALLETLPLPVIIRDAERRVTMVNAAWEAMLGVPRNEIVGKTLDSDPNRPKTVGHRETDDEVLATKKSLRYETAIHARNGTIYNVLVAKTPLVAEDGSIVGIASVTTDISEQKRIAGALQRAREAAEAAVQVKSRFLANMSHELRTPLNGVVGMASLLENTALDAKQRRFVRTLKTSAEALITLINDVLDLSKAEAGKLELDIAPVDLRREIEQVVGLFGARAHAKGIEIAAHIAPAVPPVIHGDPIRLRQVLGNLVNNAVKFTESGAVLLAVSVVDEPNSAPLLEFAVTDTGIGVDPAEQRRIFEAFEQADGSVTRKFGGTGLGLAISRQLIDLMHGTMRLESSLDRGSRFSFRLPLAAPIDIVRSDAARPDATRPGLTAESGALVIGLHPILRPAVVETLAAHGTDTVCVDSTTEGLGALRDLAARVRRLRVILDSGATSKLDQAVTALHAAAAGRALEVLALLPPDADNTPPAGVNRCLVKPLLTADLVESAPATDSAPSLRVRALPQKSRGRALVVEDNAVNQEMARAMLDMLGFDVLTAANGLEGVKSAASNPDLVLVLMDCQMPVMDGLAAARAIRAAEPAGQRVPIVALTGNAMPGDREACVAAGMDDYLAKPFSLGALRALIDRWVAVPAAGARTA